jgi:hypothetical protein
VPGALIVRRRGTQAEVRLELDPDREAEWPASPPELLLVGDDPSVPLAPVALLPVDRGTWAAEVRLTSDRPLIPAARLGQATLLGPALALPMPPEVAPRRDLPPGITVLTDIARTTGGMVRGDLLGIWDNPPSRGVAQELALWLVLAASLMLASLLVTQARSGAIGFAAAVVVLSSQVTAIPFYEQLGFMASGPVYDDAGIPHRDMHLELAGPSV